MNTEAGYEQWRNERSQIDPSAGFADQVMRAVGELPSPAGSSSTGRLPERSRVQRLVRVAACAAAVVAAVFRVVELLSVFSATGIEN